MQIPPRGRFFITVKGELTAMKDVKVLIGNYGSGKSELALNFAMQAAARGDRTELIDLDMVNTYFRLTERGKLVEREIFRTSRRGPEAVVCHLLVVATICRSMKLMRERL